MKNLFTIMCVGLVAIMSSCTSIHKTTKQPYSHVEINMDDFNLSQQKSAEATSVTILGIDFERLFIKKTGSDNYSTASVPVIGKYLADQTTGYAMYNLLDSNESGDFIFYPQVEKKTSCPIIGICLLTKITRVEVKARIGTFK